MIKEKNAIMCGSCTKFECKRNYPDGIPTWCAATGFRDALESTKKDYAIPENLEIYRAAATVIQSGYEKWPRIREAVEFATKDNHGLTCNPIAQAEICNQEGTQLNYLLGLCLGHDILFTRRSDAPVSTLIVKDRVTGHNPAAVLYADHLRRALFKPYGE